MNVQDTSREAYQGVLPVLNDRQAAVLGALTDSEPLTNAEIAQKLGWTINRVTPRCLELRTFGNVVEAGKRPCRITGRRAIVWTVAGNAPKQKPRMVPQEVVIDGIPHVRFVPEAQEGE